MIHPESNLNPVPLTTEEGYRLIIGLQKTVRSLRKQVFPNGQNGTIVSKSEVERSIDAVLTEEVKESLKAEFAKTRPRLEQALAETVMQQILPLWMPENSIVNYSVRVESRNRDGMLLSRPTVNAGYRHLTTPIHFLQASDWPSEWRSFVLLDDQLYEREDCLPENTDYLLATVHKFDALTPYGRPTGDDAVHWRVKSGPEMLWKMVAYLSGIEDDSGKTRESIVDAAGARLITRPENIGGKFSMVHESLVKGSTYLDLVEQVILQHVNYGGKTPSESMGSFMESIPRNKRSFMEKISAVESRNIKINGKSKIALPYYLEMSSRLGTDDSDAFQCNVLNTLIYPNDLFVSMNSQHGHDQFAYKSRTERRREENYTVFEWALAERLAPLMLPEPTSLRYVNDLIESNA